MKLRDFGRNGLIIQNWRIEILAIIILITLIGVGYVWLVTGRWPDWTGFSTKTLWDWMQLLIVPIVLAIGAYWLNKSVNQEEARQRASIEYDLAADKRREDALQTYLDKMTELLLDKKLYEPEVESQLRAVARARTLTVLRGLDGARKGVLLRFLYEAGLINKDNAVIYLHEANLSGANLSNANLSQAFLIYANLREADLSQAYLSEADLSNANLSFANLSGADLASTNLSRVNLSGANLSNANLNNANLRRADLSGADLNYTNLSWASLGEATLFGADLSGADLRNADLSGAKYTKNAKDIPDTIWPDGFDPKKAGVLHVNE